MTARHPRIGLTADADERGFLLLRPEYVRAVEKAGGRPLVLPTTDPARAAEALDDVDALMLTGGDDVDPALYGRDPHATTKSGRERDDFEIALVRAAIDRDMPVLGICRGQQVLNVALGGTLLQDVPSQVAGALPHRLKDVPRWQAAHEVEVLRGTRLREILGHDVLTVNSFHHQAVQDLGRGLRLSARAKDGVVEGLELPDRRFVISVQWHPEAMWNQTPDHQEVFRALVAAAEGVAR